MPQIEIETSSKEFVDSLQENKPEGISVQTRLLLRNVAGPPESGLVSVVIDIANSPITQTFFLYFCKWLYDKLKKGGTTQVTINRTVIDLTEENVTRIVKESIQIKK